MIELLFAACALIFALTSPNRKTLIQTALVTAFNAPLLFVWEAAPLAIIPIGLAFLWGTFTAFGAANMLGAIVLAGCLIRIFELVNIHFLVTAYAVGAAMVWMAIRAIGEHDVRRYALLSNAIQVAFVVLDLAVGRAVGQIGVLRHIQIFNYVLAGSLFFIAIGVLLQHGRRFDEMAGSYWSDKWVAVALVVACLSLAGLPAFNMFVSEWALFTSAYNISGILMVLGIYIAVVLFVMYYKVVYYVLNGRKKVAKTRWRIRAVASALAAACILLGTIPQIQWVIL